MRSSWFQYSEPKLDSNMHEYNCRSWAAQSDRHMNKHSLYIRTVTYYFISYRFEKKKLKSGLKRCLYCEPFPLQGGEHIDTVDQRRQWSTVHNNIGTEKNVFLEKPECWNFMIKNNSSWFESSPYHILADSIICSSSISSHRSYSSAGWVSSTVLEFMLNFTCLPFFAHGTTTSRRRTSISSTFFCSVDFASFPDAVPVIAWLTVPLVPALRAAIERSKDSARDSIVCVSGVSPSCASIFLDGNMHSYAHGEVVPTMLDHFYPANFRMFVVCFDEQYLCSCKWYLAILQNLLQSWFEAGFG